MLDLSLRDGTQKRIIEELRITQELLCELSTKLSGRDRGVEIVALPDLGMPNNVTRICGGFYTGALYKWEADVPFVPIDTTVNVDTVTLFELHGGFSNRAEFDSAIKKVILDCRGGPYVWNFGVGNHFVTYGELQMFPEKTPRPCLILHGSAAEYKAQSVGLYPTAESWYSSNIKVEWGRGRQSNRFVRYIEGVVAERFFALAKKLEPYNFDRHCYFAEKMCGDLIKEPLASRVHYGMPDQNSVSIGCQLLKEGDDFVLLTAPEQDMFLLSVARGGRNVTDVGGQELFVLPHGLGKRCAGVCSFETSPNGLSLNGQFFAIGESLARVPGLEIRYDSAGGRVLQLDMMRGICPSNVRGRLRQVYSFNAESVV